MAVFRVEKNKNYTVMSNVHLRDEKLSLKAKGLLSMFLSLPDNWNYNISGLAKISKESRSSINSGLKELEAAGYLVRRQLRDRKIRLHLRIIIWKQWKTIGKRYASLIKLGMPKNWAWRCANSRKGPYVNGRYLNRWI